ncbi:putative nucleotidyl transferase [Candidatus Vecturithrix granuli]|uniref:Putative nucleotidyl transferase n=1 Tax=Vecturithrix granuli TaxID=1499967 RepID=A0A0S6WCH1_VECG1|nr:putative nucleotidyl transferase [Candidatus Vecturithrix granuli]
MKRLREQRTLTKEEKKLLKTCSQLLKAFDPSAKIILYGSRARGDAQPDSDYDVLILTEKEATLQKEDDFRGQIYPLELETGAVITVMLYNQQTWESPLYQAMPFHQNVERDGVTL